MTEEEVIGKIKTYMDEISPYEETEVLGSSFLSQLLSENMNELLRILPLHLIEGTDIEDSSTSEHHVENEDGTGYLVCPLNFLRLMSFKMAEWSRPVIDCISEQNPRYNLQKNIYTRGKPDKPVVVKRYDRTEGGWLLEYYSVNYDHTVDRALYVAEVDDIENFQEDLIDPLCWLVASKAYSILNEGELAQMAMSKVTDFIKEHTF